MDDLGPREEYLVRKALAIAILAIERQDGPLQPHNDMQDMKAMLARMVGNDANMAALQRSARIAVTGEPD
jgi:hypothetical protein